MFWYLDSLQLNIIILLQTPDHGNCLTLKELFQVQGRFCGRSFPGPAPVAVLQIRTRFLHVPQESGEVQRVLITPRVKLQRSQRSLSSLEWHCEDQFVFHKMLDGLSVLDCELVKRCLSRENLEQNKKEMKTGENRKKINGNYVFIENCHRRPFLIIYRFSLIVWIYFLPQRIPIGKN